MRKTARTIRTILMCLAIIGLCTRQCTGRQKIEMQSSATQVDKYEKLELLINVNTRYKNPYNPDEVDLVVLLKTPSGKQITLPAFYCQDYERRKLNQGRNRTSWYYPIGQGAWKARFAPVEKGRYSATARLTDQAGTVLSKGIRFECKPSSSKGFLRISRKDPRFLEFSEGAPFFAIGQNLAFIGEGQYVNLTKAEEVFAKLSRNGANFVRIWACCKDWAMAIEARKSAWDRSWHRKENLIVPRPGSESDPAARKCIKIEGGEGTSVTASPSHQVALRPKMQYGLTGQFMADGPVALKVQVGHTAGRFEAAPKGQWQEFRQEFVTGEKDFWLGTVTFSLLGSGTIWLDNLSLAEAGAGAELLWEADVNRPTRGVYNQLDSFILDQLVEPAERSRIYLMLCVITRDLYMKSLSNSDSPDYEHAITDAKKLMCYLVARWGYSTSVASWEYFNEIDPGLPTEHFYGEVGKYLEQIDIYQHLRTTSTWHPSARDCQHPRLDIGQLHHYMRPETKEHFEDEVAVVIDKTRFLRQHAPNKPVLIGEFGLATPKWGLSEHMRRDEQGAHFHNSLWASAFAGVSGTAMFWWWDQLDKQKAYGHYQPLATFLADVSFAGLQRIKAKVSEACQRTAEEQLRLLGYQGRDRAYFWLFNPQATWWNLVVEKSQPRQIEDATIEIQGLQPGSYRIEWWHTWDGETVDSQQVSLVEGALRLTVPPLSRDIACKIMQ